MSILDAPFRSLATTLVGKFGKSATLGHIYTGAYNPVTGVASQSESTLTVRGVVERYGTSEIDGVNVLRGDVKWTVAAAAVTKTPSPNDTVDFGETTAGGDPVLYTVLAVEPVYSGDLPALYVLQLRR